MKQEYKLKIIEKALELVINATNMGISKYRIANETKINETTIGNYVNGKTKPSFANAKILIDYFESHVIYDNGITVIPKNNINNKDYFNDILNLIPLLPISAQGGTLNDFIVSVKDSDCEKVVSPIKGADFAINVSGDSMSPEYPSGSQVLIKKIDENAFINWGSVFVLDTCNGVIIKRVYPASGNDEKILCESINPKFPPFEVYKKDIYGFYKVMLCMSIK